MGKRQLRINHESQTKTYFPGTLFSKYWGKKIIAVIGRFIIIFVSI